MLLFSVVILYYSLFSLPLTIKLSKIWLQYILMIYFYVKLVFPELLEGGMTQDTFYYVTLSSIVFIQC